MLVYWVKGKVAYETLGIRVLPGKPTKFSSGDVVPEFPDIVTGFSAWILACIIGLTLAWLIFWACQKVTIRGRMKY
jgi:hypothetical protein